MSICRMGVISNLVLTVSATASVYATDFDPISLVVREAPPGESFVGRTHAGTTLMLQLPELPPITLLTTALPPLFLSGTGVYAWQYVDYTLEDPNDPDSPITSVTLDLVLDSLSAGQVRTDISVTDGGSGVSGSGSIASENSTHITIDTGAATFSISKTGSILGDASIGSVEILEESDDTGLFVKSSAGTLYSSRWGDCEATLLRNGPAAACVRIRGGLANSSQSSVLSDYELVLTAYAMGTSLRCDLVFVHSEGTVAHDLSLTFAQLVVHAIPGTDPEEVFNIISTTSQDNETTFSIETDQTARLLQLESATKVTVTPDSGPVNTIANITNSSSFSSSMLFDISRQGIGAGLRPVVIDPLITMPAAIECADSGWVAIQPWPQYSGSGTYVVSQESDHCSFVIDLRGSSVASLETTGLQANHPVLAETASN